MVKKLVSILLVLSLGVSAVFGGDSRKRSRGASSEESKGKRMPGADRVVQDSAVGAGETPEIEQSYLRDIYNLLLRDGEEINFGDADLKDLEVVDSLIGKSVDSFMDASEKGEKRRVVFGNGEFGEYSVEELEQFDFLNDQLESGGAGEDLNVILVNKKDFDSVLDIIGKIDISKVSALDLAEVLAVCYKLLAEDKLLAKLENLFVGKFLELPYEDAVGMLVKISDISPFNLYLKYYPKIKDIFFGRFGVTLPSNTSGTRLVSFSLDGSKVLVGSAIPFDSEEPDYSIPAGTNVDKSARVYDAVTGKHLKTFMGHENAVISGAFSPDGSKVVTGNTEGTVKIWDFETGEVEHAVSLDDESISFIQFSPNGKMIVVASARGPIAIYDATLSKNLFSYYKEAICGKATVTFSPDSKDVAIADDNEIGIYNIENMEIVKIFYSNKGCISSLEFTFDGKKLLFVDDKVRVLDIETEKITKVASATDRPEYAVLSSDGSKMGVIFDDPTQTKILDFNSGETVKLFQIDEGEASTMAFGLEGQFAASFYNKEAKIFGYDLSGLSQIQIIVMAYLVKNNNKLTSKQKNELASYLDGRRQKLLYDNGFVPSRLAPVKHEFWGAAAGAGFEK